MAEELINEALAAGDTSEPENEEEVTKIYYRQRLIQILAELQYELDDTRAQLEFLLAAEDMGLIIHCYESSNGKLRITAREKTPAGFPVPELAKPPQKQAPSDPL